MFRKSKNQFVVVFSLCYNLLLLKLIECDFGILGVAAISEQQRQETQHIRSELSEAFDNNKENLSVEGVIVQPLWAQHTDKAFSKGPTKVEINDQNRNEAASLRAEIERAVTADQYATPDVANTQDIRMLEASLSHKAKYKEVFETVEGNQQKFPALAREYVGAGLADKQTDRNLKAPNVITAHIDDDWDVDVHTLQRLEVSKRRTKEVLILKYIEEDFSFTFGADVNEWKHIVHAGQEYFIGRRITDLLIIRKETAKYEPAKLVDIGEVITCIETYTYWNFDQQQREGIILVATGDKVLWYRAIEDTKEIELYWDWRVGSTITDLTYFNLDSRDYLTISSNQSFLTGHYALNVYEYKLNRKEFWIAQRLQLEYSCAEVTVLNSGRDVILAIPQNNTAAIYTYNPHEAASFHIFFELKKSVAAEGILTIAGFKMGGHSYLALTGYKPQILLYEQGDFVSKTILDNNFGVVELFFPIAVQTYRDDLILLVQHKVDFSTHALTVVETLIWDGETFETSIPVPCHLGKHVVYGVGCMLDLQRDEGIKGATLLRSGNDIFAIVPRHKAESGLFRFHTELLAKNSELLDLQEIFEFLKDWVKEQDNLIAQAEDFLKIPNEQLLKHQTAVTDLESLKTPEFVFNGEVGEIYVNNYKWTSEDSATDLEMIIQSIENIDTVLNLGRQRRNLDDVIHEELDFDEVVVDELELENHNGQKFFIQNGELNFEGLVHFSELEALEKSADGRKRQVNEEDYVLDGDVEFKTINDVKWSDIKDNLIFKTAAHNFAELDVKEEVFVQSELNVNTLNSLSFPHDFMFSSGPATLVVKAEKHFVSTLSANAIDINGSVNEKNPLNAITLTDTQIWQGMPTFKHLEVAEILELHGQVRGRDKNIFPQNPTLQEDNNIEATCHFSDLVVNGPIVLKGEMDGRPLGSRLKDILLKSQDQNKEILVPSLKTFDTVTFGTDFHIENNTINRVSVHDFVTIHTEQNLNITSLDGYLYFYNLTVNGSFDGVKIENVLKDVILLKDAVNLPATELIFPEELNASSISVIATVNNRSIKGNLQTLQEDLNIVSATFQNLQAQQADFSQDILGQGKLNSIELHTVVNDRSWHEPPIRGNIFLNELILEQELQTDELHGIRAEYVLDFLNHIEELPEMVLNGQIQVDQITVTGDVQLHKLNGLLFDEEIQLAAVKLNRPNFLPNNLNFKNRLNVQGHLNVLGAYRGNYLPDVIDDIVVRSTDACIDIKATKTFTNHVKVVQNTHVKALNGIPIQNFACLSKENHFLGSLHLKGNLIVRDVNLQGSINDLNWQDIKNLLYFDSELNNFVLKNTTEFKTLLFLEDLTVKGNLNDVSNVSDFFQNLIYKNQLCVLKGKNTFTGRVSIDEGIFIENLNGQDLMHLFNNLVFIQGPPQLVVIEDLITFGSPIQANDVKVQQSLKVQHLNGCSIKEWATNSLRVDQDHYIPHGLTFSTGSIDDNCLHVHYVNDKDLSRIITLNTPQTFNETVKFSDVVLNGCIVSKGLINNLDLEKEFNNTLMIYGQQHTSTPLTIHSVIVLGNLTVRGLVNSDKDLRDVATLRENLVFESPLYFKSIYSPQVVMRDSVTGINFDKWFDSAVKYYCSDTQYITGNWSTKFLKVDSVSKDVHYTTNGYYSYQRLPRNNKREIHEGEEVCLLIRQIWQDLSRQSVYIKYIEEFQTDFDIKIKNFNENLKKKMFYLRSSEGNFLLINVNCTSYIYKWLAKESRFIFKYSFESGSIDEIEVKPVSKDTTTLKFISTSAAAEETKCPLKTVNIWKLENDSIVVDNDLSKISQLLYRMQGNNISLWSLNNETIKELDLDYKMKREWHLPIEPNKTLYRFVPLEDNQKILLTNGDLLALLTNNSEKKFKKSTFPTHKSLNLQTSNYANQKMINTESVLKPNASFEYIFSFSDFKPIMKRILIDLSQHINQQINITQLSIPETDLFDEHLVPDFIGIIEELRNQSIYSPEVFNISLDKLTLPENSAQVLAARIVPICWTVVMQIEDIQSSLTTNVSQDHPLCSHISKSLGRLIKDVVILANEQNSSAGTADHNLRLTIVVERIRKFDKELREFVNALENRHSIQTTKVKKPQKELNESPTTVKNRKFRTLSKNEDDLVFLENPHLPGYKQGEILSFTVGSTINVRHIWAVTKPQKHPGLHLYLQGLKTELYQVIQATQPRSLQQLRISQETFLLYIDGCCQVSILRYRGLQGFENFATVHSSDYIMQILAMTLPHHSGILKYSIALLLENNIKLYEFVIEGSNIEAVPLPLNCL